MKKVVIIFLIFVRVIIIMQAKRYDVIEDFDSGTIELFSWLDEDIESELWQLDSSITFDNSPFSLKLYGNTWKQQLIAPRIITSNQIWQVQIFAETIGTIQGIGFADSSNVLLYSFFGNALLDINLWVTVYQGASPTQNWVEFMLPVADDWLAYFDYLPEITSLVFINDNDNNGAGIVYFDLIMDVTADLPKAPQAEIEYEIFHDFQKNNLRYVDVAFNAIIFDEDSDVFTYFWDFADGNYSTDEQPTHRFLIEDSHLYTVTLQVTDDSNQIGYASCKIEVDEGESSFPVTLNFVGDIMLARAYNTGIIPNLGLEAIFEPTLEIFGYGADLSIANLESPFTTSTIPHPTKPIVFKGHPDYAAGLAYAGIEKVMLANNHILDYLYPGLLETQIALDTYQILHSGAGIDRYEATRPLFISKKGKSFAFLACSDRTGQYNNYQPYLHAGFNKAGFAYMTPYYISQQINEVRDVADFVIIETHSGSEYSTAPGADYDKENFEENDLDEHYSAFLDVPHMWDREIRHFMIDAGADLVICHHPHIIQGVEVYNGKLIAHSLGNFVFDLTYPETMPSMILQTEVDERGFYAFSILPVFIDGFIPKPTTGELSKHILHYLAHKSKELNTYLDVNYEENKAFVIMDTLNMEVYSQPFLKFFGLQESNDYYISTPLKLTRWGNPSEINSLNSVDVWQFRSGTELIYYGNMEDEGSNMWNLNSSSEWYDIEEKFEGERSIGQTRNSSQTGNVITDFKNLHKLTPYQNYTLQGYVKTQNGANVTIEIRYYSSRDYYSQISTESVGTQLSGDNDWTYLHQEITVPPQAKFFDIRLVSFPPETGTAFSWFDNISLIGWNSWKYISEDAMIKSPNNFYYLQLKSEQFHLFNELIYTETKYHYDTAVVAENVNSPTLNAKLQQNFPNPFNANTMISFSLHKSAQVHLSLYNIKGQKVTTLIHSSLAAGNHQYEWNGKNFNNEPVASGIYFYQLKADNKIIATKKCLLLK